MAPISRAKLPSTVLPLATLYKPILLSPDIFIGLYEELVLKVLLELSFVSKVKFLSFVVCISKATAFLNRLLLNFLHIIQKYLYLLN